MQRIMLYWYQPKGIPDVAIPKSIAHTLDTFITIKIKFSQKCVTFLF